MTKAEEEAIVYYRETISRLRKENHRIREAATTRLLSSYAWLKHSEDLKRIGLTLPKEDVPIGIVINHLIELVTSLWQQNKELKKQIKQNVSQVKKKVTKKT